MNCKQGDLAIIVESAAGNEGRIVTCVRLTGIIGCINPNLENEDGPVWEIDRELRGWCGNYDRFILDSQLRPIRDPGDEAVDEIVELVGSPLEIAA